MTSRAAAISHAVATSRAVVTLRVVVVGAVVLALHACAVTREPTAPASTPSPTAASTTTSTAVGFLAFGDTGYHADYIEADDIAATPAAFIEKEREEWIEDNRPPAEFAYPPMQALAQGGYSAASGLMPVAATMRRFCDDLAGGSATGTATKITATATATATATKACAFGAMLGDNVYPDGLTLGADGRSDAERLRKLFIEPFGSLRADDADFRIYMMLGNHDWHISRESALAQVNFAESTRPFFMDGLFYRVRPPAGNGDIEIFVIDTNMLLAPMQVREGGISDEGNEIVYPELEDHGAWEQPVTQDERDMAAWLERVLADSQAKWKIVMGHHPLWSSAGSKFEQARVLRSLILPALCRHADLYLAGHEHTLEAHLQDCAAVPGSKHGPLLNVVSGAGAKQRPLNSRFVARQSEMYADHEPLWAQGLVWGFAHVMLDGDRGTLQLVSTPNDGSGIPVTAFTHEFTRRIGAQAPAATRGSP